MSDAAQAGPVEREDLLAQVDALRCPTDAAQRQDPVRLHFIEALARRLQVAPPAVQQVLQPKLEAALKGMGGGAEAAAPVVSSETGETRITAVHTEPVEGLTPPLAARKPRPKTKTTTQTEAAPPAAPLSLLGQLNQYIHTASPPLSMGPPSGAGATARQDLKSAVRFRETWARISAETEVDKATHRAPENAGPLNAHNLVLRTLAMMRDLSPDYLRRFMSHTESLLWLDQAYGQLKQPGGKAKAAKAGKSRA